MKILFLDFDGVLNAHHATKEQWRGVIGLDPKLAKKVKHIVDFTNCRIVLSSSWRNSDDWMEAARDQAGMDLNDFIGVTPNRRGLTSRGTEIKEWLDERNRLSDGTYMPVVERYAILDDNSDMLQEQMPNFFQTQWNVGLTDQIAFRVIEHLNAV